MNLMILNKKSIGKWSDENGPKEHLGGNCLDGDCYESEQHEWKLFQEGNIGLRVDCGGSLRLGIFYSPQNSYFGMSQGFARVPCICLSFIRLSKFQQGSYRSCKWQLYVSLETYTISMIKVSKWFMSIDMNHNLPHIKFLTSNFIWYRLKSHISINIVI